MTPDHDAEPDDELRHECGIAALYHYAKDVDPKCRVWRGKPSRIVDLMPRMLQDLQNRGQLAAGLSSYNPDVLVKSQTDNKDLKRELLLDTHKDLGTVSEAFEMSRPEKFRKLLDEFEGYAAIGHTRYATSGPTGRSHAQPFELQHSCRWKWFAFAFNGNLANYETLRDEIHSNEHVHLTRANDTQVILHLLSEQMLVTEKPDLLEIFRKITPRLDGAYNLVFLNALGEMVVLRDPLGLRPLCYVDNGRLFAAASESVPLLNLGFDEEEVKSLNPGELLLITEAGVQKHRYAEPRTPKHCFFEWIYFANVASTLDNRSVYLSRTKLGEELAELEIQDNLFVRDEDTIVVPVPDTGKAAADSMAYKLNLRSVEGLIRNRYIGRTFIEAGDRAAKVRAKFTALRHILKGKRVLLVEDSIVRSTTLRNLIGYIREVGQAKEIHVRVACPPIIAPCFYGIDMATVKQLYAYRFLNGKKFLDRADMDEMARDLEANTLRYLPVEALSRCIEKPPEYLCQACVTGDYPTQRGQEKYQLELVTGETANESGGCHPMRQGLPMLNGLRPTEAEPTAAVRN
jgi:amidophosphoribosyltransferase